MTTDPKPDRSPNRRRQLFAFGALLLLFACSVFTTVEKVPPQQWAKGRGPVVPHDTFPADCTLCHVAGGWQEIRADFQFDHGAKTGVELNGAHQGAECLRCHNDRGPVKKYSARGCAGCHEDWHRRQLGVNCEDCHGEADWLPKEVIATHNRTRFPLIGAHAGVACFRCHEGAQVGIFKRADQRCETCHQADLARATTPNHVTTGWTSDCQRCHAPIAWKGQAFVHTTYPLTGAHAHTACAKCHIGGVYKGTPRNCVDCHQVDYNGTTNPNHITAGFPTNCEACHTTTSWNGAAFIHSFPRSGPHNVSCATCHTTPGNLMAFDCLVCHDHNRTKMDDKHKGEAGYSYTSSACLVCHPNGK